MKNSTKTVKISAVIDKPKPFGISMLPSLYQKLRECSNFTKVPISQLVAEGIKKELKSRRME